MMFPIKQAAKGTGLLCLSFCRMPWQTAMLLQSLARPLQAPLENIIAADELLVAKVIQSRCGSR